MPTRPRADDDGGRDTTEPSDAETEPRGRGGDPRTSADSVGAAPTSRARGGARHPAGAGDPSGTPATARARDGGGTPSDRRPTITEQARRAQLVAVTIDLVAAHGYAGCSLQRIADAAGITKGAVIYHFATKNAVIRAAYGAVIDALTGRVTAALDRASSPAGAVDAYVEAMIGHMAENPTHVRMLVEALNPTNDTGIADRPNSPARQQPLAELIAAAVASGEYRPDLDAATLAVILTGAIDAVVAQTLTDPGYDLVVGTAGILDMLHRTARSAADR